MKRFLLYLLTIAAFVACSKGEDEDSGNSEPTPEKPKTEIKIDTSTSDFTTEGGDNTISFTTNEAWTAQVINSRADDWCKIHPTSGAAGNATITVTTTPNDTPDDRTASIIIKAGAVSKTVTVSQKQKDALTITASKFEVAAAGGEVAIEVKANIDFEYVIDDDAKEWISYEGTRALKTSKLAFKIAENDDIEKREGQIFIKNGELVEAVTIYQDGAEPSIVISKNEYVVSSDGETISVEVKSNVDVAIELTAEADWISENTSRATSTNTYRFDISPNESYDQRSAEIKFTNKENNLSEVVRVTQTQKNALVVAKDSYTVDSEGDQIQIEIGHNVDFDIEIANDWITKVDTRAFVTETLVFNIAKHTGYDNREGTIVFKSKDGKLSQTVKVYQAQEDALIISKKDIVVSDEGGTISFELQTNVDFKVSDPNVDWLRAITTRGLATHTLSYTVDANTSYDSREAKIVVTDTKNNKSETITITQAQKDAIVLAKSEYEFGIDGGNLDFEIQTNVDITVTISDNAKDWIQQVETRALETKALYFNVAACSAEEDREGTITISGGNATQTITVKQSGLKEILEKEREALIAFYNATGGDNWTNNTNWCSDKPVSEWYGIRTDNLGYICDISLWENNLIGEIPIRLCELAKLKYLDLSANMLSGCIPDDIGRLSQLESLILQNNKLKGSIPKSIGELKNLTNLSIGENNLEGSIPPEIGNLSELKHISAFSNMLSGSIPEELCQLVKLESVFIRSTLLSGPIPANIGNLKNLKYLNLCQNSLSGKVPESIIQLENLEELTLVENKSLDIDLPQSTFLDTHWGQMLPENTYDLTKLHINFNSFNMIDLNGNQLDSETIFSSNKYTLMYHYSTTRMYEDINDINRLKQLYSDCSEEGFEIIGYVNGEYNGINVPQLKDVEMFISENDIPWSNVFMTKDNCMNVKYVFYPYIAPTFTIVDSTGRVVFFDYAKFDTEIRSVVKSVVGFVKRQFNKDQDIYKSTDYSQDGKVTTLQTATKGNGIDIVLMGDAYSDRQIADGTYKSAMENIYNNLFTEEPYKSFKDHFNVYYVNVVSLNEGYEYEYGNTALEGFFGEGTLVGGNNNAVFTYTLNAIPSDKMDNALLVVAMNSDNYAGTCYMFNSVGNGDYGSGVSVAYFPRGGNAETFAQLLHHEACGHGFAKLADEYAYENMGAIPEAAVNDHKAQQTNWGWWKNVDFTSDPTKVRWNYFLTDTRYANDGLGAFEGGLTYWTGVWRPTENSIMRYNTGGFNAPSREAIYYRIHRLAYGDEWTYDYETFVEYDEINRTTTTTTQSVPMIYKPTAPPVVMQKNWRDELR